MLTLDMLLRGGAIALGIFVSLALLTDPCVRTRTRSVPATAACAAGYLIASAPFTATLPPWLAAIAITLAIFLPLAFTWLVVDVFLDEAAARVPWLRLAAVIVALSIPGLWIPVVQTMRELLFVALCAGLLYVAVTTARGDLVENRRRARPFFLAAMSGLGMVIALFEVWGLDALLPTAFYIAQSAAFLSLVTAFGLWSLAPKEEICPAGERLPEPQQAPHPPAKDTDPEIVARLDAAMKSGAWRREGLTIGELASDLNVPEHHLRAAINRGLGYRNFPAFINSHRIAAAKDALADPTNARRTVLEIAYDCGFASLGPFNRAFRAETGQTPTDFRKAAHAGLPIPE